MRGGKFHSDRQGGPGWGEHAYHGRIREEERRHVEGVVQRLLRLDRERPADGLLVAGSGRAVATLALALPPALADRLVATTRLNPTEVTPAVVARAARAARAKHGPAVERELLAELEKRLGRGGPRTGSGRRCARSRRGKCARSLVRADVRGTGFRCALSGRLVLSAATVSPRGSRRPWRISSERRCGRSPSTGPP